MNIHTLKIEHLSNPIGIDVEYPSFMWSVDSCLKQTAYQIKVLRAGICIWDRKKVHSTKNYGIIYQGKKLDSRDICHVELKVWNENDIVTEYKQPAKFEMGLLNSAQWVASWITDSSSLDNRNGLYLRKKFEINDQIISAKLYCSSLGIYTPYLNGEKIGNQVLTPGSTNYHQRIQYQVYDVTKYLLKGINVIGAIVGDGWYRGSNGMRSNKNVFGDQIGFIAQLEVETNAGKYQINTDESWMSSLSGAIQTNDLKHGEYYDARNFSTEFSNIDYEQNMFKRCEVLNQTKNTLIASLGLSIVEQQSIIPKVSKQLEWIDASYKSIIGKIKVKWKWNSNQIEFEVNVPANTEAELYFNNQSHHLNVGNNKLSFGGNMNQIAYPYLPLDEYIADG